MCQKSTTKKGCEVLNQNSEIYFYFSSTTKKKEEDDRKWQQLLVNDYVEQLSFFEKDCCFTQFRGDVQSSSVRLNAFAIGVHHLAGQLDERYLVIDRNALRSAIDFVLKHQLPNGAFLENDFNPLLYKMFPNSDYKTAQLLMMQSSATLADFTQKEAAKKSDETRSFDNPSTGDTSRKLPFKNNSNHLIFNPFKYSAFSGTEKQFTEKAKEDPDRFAKSENNFGFRYTPVALSALVLVSLNRIETIDGKLGAKIEKAKAKAAAYLEANLVQLDSSYEIAISTFALLTTPKNLRNADPQLGVEMLKQRARVNDRMLYWSRVELEDWEDYKPEAQPASVRPRPMQRFDSEAVEASAYALLIYNRLNLDARHMIVSYLNHVRLHLNGFVTPYDTIVALESLIDYSLRSDHRASMDMKIVFRFSSEPEQQHELRIDKENMCEQNCFSLTDRVHGHVVVQARGGGGLALMQLRTEYSITRKELLIQPKIRSFQLDVK